MVLEDHPWAPSPAAAEGWVFSKHTNVAPITALAWHSGLKDGRAGGGPGTAMRRLLAAVPESVLHVLNPIADYLAMPGPKSTKSWISSPKTCFGNRLKM